MVPEFGAGNGTVPLSALVGSHAVHAWPLLVAMSPVLVAVSPGRYRIALRQPHGRYACGWRDSCYAVARTANSAATDSARSCQSTSIEAGLKVKISSGQCLSVCQALTGRPAAAIARARVGYSPYGGPKSSLSHAVSSRYSLYLPGRPRAARTSSSLPPRLSTSVAIISSLSVAGFLNSPMIISLRLVVAGRGSGCELGFERDPLVLAEPAHPAVLRDTQAVHDLDAPGLADARHGLDQRRHLHSGQGVVGRGFPQDVRDGRGALLEELLHLGALKADQLGLLKGCGALLGGHDR